MKLIVTAQGPEKTAEVDPRFGRARYFIVFDDETESYESLDNQEQVDATQGAGVQAAQNVVTSRASAVLTGHCGPKAFQILNVADVAVYSGVTGTVEEAVQAWREGRFEKLSQPDGTPHH